MPEFQSFKAMTTIHLRTVEGLGCEVTRQGLHSSTSIERVTCPACRAAEEGR